MKNNVSYIWKSIWAAWSTVEMGLCWKVGKSSDISALNDAWVPELENSRLMSFVNDMSDFRIAELIDNNSRSWKKELIEVTFPEEVVVKILRTPLAEEPHEDLRAWNGEPSGEFTVRSAYKLL